MNTLSALALRIDPLRRLLSLLSNLLALGMRLYVAHDFFAAGLTKIRSWDATLFLFEDEYHVPILSPHVAAVMGTFGELFFPVLLALGLGGRFAAFSLSFVNLVAVISYPGIAPAALKDHYLWASMLLVILFYGPGKISLDAWLWPKLTGRKD